MKEARGADEEAHGADAMGEAPGANREAQRADSGEEQL